MALISKKHGNNNRRKDKLDEQRSLVIELIGDGRNFNNETVARLYNTVADRMGWASITAGTVANYKKEYPEAFAGRHGAQALRNEKLMQVKRFTSSAPMYFWTADGWDVELLYQRTYINKDGRQVTTYHNRPTVVAIVDPFNYYIIGYAIGTQETPDLIRAAFRNAFEHVYELFGDYYQPWQIQTDNYQKKVLTPFYQSLARYYTPAAVKNAKAKPVESFFNRFNDECFRSLLNSSGKGVKSKTKLQVSDDWIDNHKKDFPDYEGCVRQIEAGIAYLRKKAVAQYLEAWKALPEEKRRPFSRIDWLAAFGVLAPPRKLRPSGIYLQVDGQPYQYDSFDPEFRNYGHRSFFLRYDPADMSQVLAIENTGTEKQPLEAGARFLLERKYEQPLALMDRREGDFEELERVREFNRAMREDIIQKRKASAETVRAFFEENEERLRDTLTAHVITDSLGRHKDQRNVLRTAPLPTELPSPKDTGEGTDDYMVSIDENDFLNDF